MKKIVFVVFVVALFLLWDGYRFLNSVIVLGQNTIVVERGSSFADLKDQLLNKNSSWLAAVYYPIYIRWYQPVLKYGPHVFKSGATFDQAVAILVKDPENIKVRLPEGERMETFATLLSNSGLSNQKEILNCLKTCVVNEGSGLLDSKTGYEGFLFPDTYIFQPNASPKAVLIEILQNFHSKFAALASKHQLFLQDHTVREVIIMASLLEREARSLAEKQMVAGILYNRLARGMRLDVDASVSYLKGDWRSPITFQDISLDSSYNTRKNLGFPPGPICSPGVESIEAALSPSVSTYLYYLTGKNGRMYYARTLEEHNLNKAKYL